MPVENGSQVNHFSSLDTDNSEIGQDTLRALKGAPLSVLIALAAYGHQSRVQLAERTGWSYNAVKQALAELEAMGFVSRAAYRAWSFAPQGNCHALWTLVLAAEELFSHAPSQREVVSGATSESLCDADIRNRPVAEVVSIGGLPVDKAGQLVTDGSLAVDNRAEVLPESASAPLHDHDGVIINNNRGKDLKHHPTTSTEEVEALAQALRRLTPPFDNAKQWLQEVSLRLVAGWLEHLQAMDHTSRAQIRNEAAFLRWKVQTKQEPPSRPAHQAPCPECGRILRNAQGHCLVCLGVVVV